MDKREKRKYADKQRRNEEIRRETLRYIKGEIKNENDD